MMGSPSNEPERVNDESQHRVTISKPFYMQTTEVTIGHWRGFVRDTGFRSEAETEGWAWILTGGKWEMKEGYYWDNPGFSQTDRHPVTCVSWNDVQAFVKWLKHKEGGNYRLPTEAEWEYAGRSGSTTRFCFGDSYGQFGEYAWYDSNSSSKTHSVGQKKPNAWGLYDMHGNVWEWCQDWYGGYLSGHVTDPKGSSSGSSRVFRGGSWNSRARYCRSAYRGRFDPGRRSSFIGFRLARTR